MAHMGLQGDMGSVGAHLDNPFSRALAGGALNQPVNVFDPPFGSGTSLHEDNCIGKHTATGGGSQCMRHGQGQIVGNTLTRLCHRLDIGMFSTCSDFEIHACARVLTAYYFCDNQPLCSSQPHTALYG